VNTHKADTHPPILTPQAKVISRMPGLKTMALCIYLKNNKFAVPWIIPSA